jgi:hypothetical protein
MSELHPIKWLKRRLGLGDSKQGIAKPQSAVESQLAVSVNGNGAAHHHERVTTH